ncbi:mucin-17-like, partial [Theristicus caerulescens]
ATSTAAPTNTTQVTSTAPTTTTEAPSTAPTTETISTTTSSTFPPVYCQNGGVYDGIKCICSAQFYGPLCEYSTSSIDTTLPFPGTILAQTQLVVTVTNFNYTEELEDTQSETYRSFEEHFKKEIKKIYGNIPGYEGVKIISLKSGSIVVDHEVFFTVTETKNTTENFEVITKDLVGKLQETVASQGACQHNNTVLCLTVSPNPISKNMTAAPSLDGICWQRAPNEYRDFYYALPMDGVIRCITNCTPNTPNTMDCNYGQCHVTRTGPRCFCQDEALYWYTGTQCSGRISKLAMGLGLVATVFFIGCIVLTVVLIRNRRRKSWSDAQSSTGDNWYEDDGCTWNSEDGFFYSNRGAGSTTGSETQSKFTPSLELVDTSTSMRISRPKVTTRL